MSPGRTENVCCYHSFIHSFHFLFHALAVDGRTSTALDSTSRCSTCVPSTSCAGWHFRLNAKARKNSLPLYVLIRLLHREATTVTWQMRLLSEGKVLRCRRARQQTVEARLTKAKLWTEFRDGERSAYRLLRAAANVYCSSAV